MDGQWDDLNKAFYARDKGAHAYVAARLKALREYDDADAQLIESVDLLHHAAEALVRQYLAHRDSPDCPWLENARLSNFAAFKKEVAALRESLERDDVLATIIEVFGGPGSGRTAAAGQARAVAVEGLGSLFKYASALLLDEAGTYNALKHGVAAVPGTRRLPDGAPVTITVRGDGRSLVTLQSLKESNSAHAEYRWNQVVTYVDVGENSAITQLIAEQLENLWKVARARYVGAPLGRLNRITQEQADLARYPAGLDAPAFIEEIAVSLHYEVREESSEASASTA